MSWFSTVVIGLLGGLFGCFGAGLLATFCVRWYRIPAMEGASGYYVVTIALLGAFGGLLTGTVLSRFAPAGDGEFLHGLGTAFAGITGLLIAIGIVCRLAADIPPEINGKPLQLAIEVACPQDFTLPAKTDPYGTFAALFLAGGADKARGEMRLEAARQQEGRWIVPATLPLNTSASTKLLRVYFSESDDTVFALHLRSHPTAGDFVWSKWIEGRPDGRKPDAGAPRKFRLRYRVEPAPPPPQYPTQAELDARAAAEEQARFDALSPDAPITTWLEHVRPGTPEDRRQKAVRILAARPDLVHELAPLMVSPDQPTASNALRVIEHLPQPSPALIPPVAEAGRHLIDLMRKANQIPMAEDPNYAWAEDVSARFRAWMAAAGTLREKCGADFTAELGEILKLSRIRDDSHEMRFNVRRVASYYMKEWAGLEPVAGDPPPR